MFWPPLSCPATMAPLFVASARQTIKFLISCDSNRQITEITRHCLKADVTCLIAAPVGGAVGREADHWQAAIALA